MEERVLGGKRFTWFGQDAKNANAKPNPKNLPVGVAHLLPLHLLARPGGSYSILFLQAGGSWNNLRTKITSLFALSTFP